MVDDRTAPTADVPPILVSRSRSVEITTGIVDVADTAVQKKPYGEMCQHYINVRRDDKDVHLRFVSSRKLTDVKEIIRTKGLFPDY